MDNNTEVLTVEIRYIKAALDEMRREDLPAIRQEVRQAIQDEIVPLELRVSNLESEMRIIDKRVWVMFGTAALVIPTLIGSLITATIGYFTVSGF